MEHRNGDVLPVEIMARREEWSRGVSVYLRQVVYGVETRYAEPVVFSKIENEFEVAPCMKLSIQSAQQFMDELWQCGLRPTEGTGSAGAFAAQGRHLEDMRRLVFKDEDKKG